MFKLVLGGLAAIGLAACGKTVAFTDANNGDDSGADGGVVDAAVGTANIVTNAHYNSLPGNASGPVQGVAVVSIDDDGSVRAQAASDATGHATIAVKGGGSVTVVYPVQPNGQEYLDSILGVEPGDTLTFGELVYPSTGTLIAQMTVSWPFDATVSNWTIVSTCQGANTVGDNTSALVTLYDYCYQSPATDVIVLGYDATGTLVKWGIADDQAWVNGGVLAISTLQQPSTFTWAFTGLPADISYLSSYVNAIDQIAAPIGFGSNGPVTGGTYSYSTPIAPGADGLSIYAQFQEATDVGVQTFIQHLPITATSWNGPFTFLPWVSRQVIANGAARQVQWVEKGTGDYSDTALFLYWNRSTGGSAAAGSGQNLGTIAPTNFYWDVIAPPGVIGLSLPTLPSALATFGPGETDILNANVQLVKSSAWTSYHDVKATPEWEMLCPDCIPLDTANFPKVTYSYGGGGK